MTPAGCCGAGAIIAAPGADTAIDMPGGDAASPTGETSSCPSPPISSAPSQFAVQGATCAACMLRIERGINAMPGVTAARYNLSQHRLSVTFDDGAALSDADIINKLDQLGYQGRSFSEDASDREEKAREQGLLRVMAVAGFAAANLMLLSVSVWSGNATGIEPETRALFHWFQALIALPAAAYAGQPFFTSAARALSRRQLNMDVPISLAVILALGMSLSQTINNAPDAYFDSAVMLLFFLLIGRFLDARSRRRTRNLGANLLALQKPTALRLEADGSAREVATADIRPGDRVLVPAGTRFAVDGVVLSGQSTIDAGLITGESTPQESAPGQDVFAGTLNLSGALTIKARAAGTGTLLAEISALMDRASAKRGAHIRIADKAAQIYAPAVHLFALATFLGWLGFGTGWQAAMLNAVAVLIITCPCALGLAVPVVQVVATGALFRAGVLVNQGDALERLAEADTILFDKTGTLSEPEPGIVNAAEIAPEDLQLAARLALSSHHVLARTLAHHASERTPFADVRETPGAGVSADIDGVMARLGSRSFCGLPDVAEADAGAPAWTELVLRYGDQPPVIFQFAQSLREDAAETVRTLAAHGYHIEILSGDRQAPVAETARQLGISDWHAQMRPQDKIDHVEALRAAGRKVVMVGDGLNDAAALQAANVSVAPASALDITQAAADIIIIGRRLAPLIAAIRTARRARRLMFENFALAGAYNLVAVPLAIAGLVTPLIAALSMSGSSIVVTLNALRAQLGTPKDRGGAP